MKKAFLLFLAVLMAFVMMSCEVGTPTVPGNPDNPGTSTYYTVSFYNNGYGRHVQSQTIAEGKCATKIADPTSSEATFAGWYDNASCTGAAFDFNTPITKDTKLYAKWTLKADAERILGTWLPIDVDEDEDIIGALLRENGIPLGHLHVEYPTTLTGALDDIDYCVCCMDTVPCFEISEGLIADTRYVKTTTFYQYDSESPGDPEMREDVTSEFMKYPEVIAAIIEEAFSDIQQSNPYEMDLENKKLVLLVDPNGEIDQEIDYEFIGEGMLLLSAGDDIVSMSMILVRENLVADTSYTVSFEMNGHGAAVESQTVQGFDYAVKPASPTASGLIFAGWYTDSAFSGGPFDFTNHPIASDTTLYAKWITAEEANKIYGKWYNVLGPFSFSDEITLEEEFDYHCYQCIIDGNKFVQFTPVEMNYGFNILGIHLYGAEDTEHEGPEISSSIPSDELAAIHAFYDGIYNMSYPVLGEEIPFTIDFENQVVVLDEEEPLLNLYYDMPFDNVMVGASFLFSRLVNPEWLDDAFFVLYREGTSFDGYCVVRFETGHDVMPVLPQVITSGGKATKPDEIGVKFYVDEDRTVLFNFDTPITEDVTIYVERPIM